MEKNTDNDNKSDTKVSTSKSVENTETVEKPKRPKRKFEWTPKRNVLLHEKIKFK